MRHTLGDVTFEIPDDLQDFSEYTYLSPDRPEQLMIELESNESVDANALIANARSDYEGLFGPLIIYSSPTTFTRGGGAKAGGLEGEQRDMNDASLRLRFALAAIASARGKAVLLYHRKSRPDALLLLRRVVASTFVLGERGAENRAMPAGWTRRQANRILFVLPRGWTGPTSLLFRADVEVMVTVAEPSVPEGTIDLSAEGPIAGVAGPGRTITKVKTEPIGGPGFDGWMGEWRSAARPAASSDEKIVRKMSVRAAGTTVVTAYGKAPVSAARRLEQTWEAFRQSLQPARGV